MKITLNELFKISRRSPGYAVELTTGETLSNFRYYTRNGRTRRSYVEADAQGGGTFLAEGVTVVSIKD